MIDLGRGIPIYRTTIDAMLIGEPDSLLIVEFHGDDDAPLLQKLAELETMMGDLAIRVGGPCHRARLPGRHRRRARGRAEHHDVDEGRRQARLLHRGCAVDLDDLADYTERLNEVFERHGTRGTWYAHASVGCLHVRPVLNMKDATDVAHHAGGGRGVLRAGARVQGLALAASTGTGSCGASSTPRCSARGWYSAFDAVKEAFDPAGLLNPNRIVRSAAHG